MKVCKICNENKEIDEFVKDKRKPDGTRPYCLVCNRKARAPWIDANRDLVRKSARKSREKYKEKNTLASNSWYQKNKARKQEKNKAWKLLHKDELKIHNRIYTRKKRATDINFKLASCLRTRIGSALKRNQKAGSAVNDLGCSVDFLRQYLESKFQPGMSWENHGNRGWHIDHTKALANFDLSDRNQFLEACHYTNLQPLWAKENRSKSNKI